MKKAFIVALLGASSVAHADVVPNNLAAVEGDSNHFTFNASSLGGRYQMIIAANQMNSMTNMNLTGLRWRLDGAASASWPGANDNFSFFDIAIGPGVAPSAASNTFASNFTAAPTSVRSGALAVTAGSFSSGASPNAFGPAVTFDNPYHYTGGNLTIELRYSNLSGSAPSLDGVLVTSGPGNGYGVDFSARGTLAGSNATTGTATNFIVTDIVAVPEPATITLLATSLAGIAMRRRKTAG